MVISRGNITQQVSKPKGKKMPVKKTKKGYKFGSSGKEYPTKEQADKQAKAIYASRLQR